MLFDQNNTKITRFEQFDWQYHTYEVSLFWKTLILLQLNKVINLYIFC